MLSLSLYFTLKAQALEQETVQESALNKNAELHTTLLTLKNAQQYSPIKKIKSYLQDNLPQGSTVTEKKIQRGEMTFEIRTSGTAKDLTRLLLEGSRPEGPLKDAQVKVLETGESNVSAQIQ